jgi:hypothetical protein
MAIGCAADIAIDGGDGSYHRGGPALGLAGQQPSGGSPSQGDVWRVNLYSFRDGQRQALAWSPILGEGNFHRASRFGRLRFAASPNP